MMAKFFRCNWTGADFGDWLWHWQWTWWLLLRASGSLVHLVKTKIHMEF